MLYIHVPKTSSITNMKNLIFFEFPEKHGREIHFIGKRKKTLYRERENFLIHSIQGKFHPVKTACQKCRSM
jgi:hypothetical protein